MGSGAGVPLLFVHAFPLNRTMWAPQVSLTEGLHVESQHFLECVKHRRQPLTDGPCGLRLVRILEAAARSLGERGQPVTLPVDASARSVELDLMRRSA